MTRIQQASQAIAGSALVLLLAAPSTLQAQDARSGLRINDTPPEAQPLYDQGQCTACHDRCRQTRDTSVQGCHDDTCRSNTDRDFGSCDNGCGAQAACQTTRERSEHDLQDHEHGDTDRGSTDRGDRGHSEHDRADRSRDRRGR